jgi:hypothetical protein
MMSPNANNETVHNNSSDQPGSDENSHSLSVQHETVARDQQYESIVDTGYEHLIAQYEPVHNNTLEHIETEAIQVNQLEIQPTADRWVNNVDEDGYWRVLDEQARQVNQLEGRPAVGRWVNNVDDDGYWQVLNDEQNAPFDVGMHLKILNDDCLAISEQSVDCTQWVRQAANVDSYGYLQPVVNNDTEVQVLPLVSLNSNGFTATEYNTSNQLHPLYAAQDHTLPNPPRTAPNHENRPQLPAPLVNNQPTSNTTSTNLKLPVRLQSFKK